MLGVERLPSMIALTFAVTIVLAMQGRGLADLTMHTYSNAGFAGNPQTSTVASIDGKATRFVTSDPLSIQIIGTLTPPEQALSSSAPHLVWCNATNMDGFLWLDDHLICAFGYDRNVWSDFMTDANQIPLDLASKAFNSNITLRMEAKCVPNASNTDCSVSVLWAPVSNNPTSLGCFIDGINGTRDLPFNAGDSDHDNSPATCSQKCASFLFFGVQDGRNCFCGDAYGSQGQAPSSDCNMSCTGNSSINCGGQWRNSIYSRIELDKAAPLPSSALSTYFPAEHAKRLAVGRQLLHNQWRTWSTPSVTAQVLLPHGIVLHVGLCQISNGQCQQDGTMDDITKRLIRPGMYAYDSSYTQLYWAFNGLNISLETSQPSNTSDLVIVASAISGNNVSDFGLLLVPEFANNVSNAFWRLPGSVSSSLTGPGSIHFQPSGQQSVSVYGASGQQTTAPGFIQHQNALFFPFGSGGSSSSSLAVSTMQGTTLSKLKSIIKAGHDAESDRLSKFGQHADAKLISQAAMMWTEVHSPEIAGPYSPVSRGWVRDDILIFDWDNIFGSYQLSIDNPLQAYSQLAAVIKSKTAHGMVPNFWKPNLPSRDRTEPIVGSKVLLEIFKKYGDRWIVDLLFDDLYDWQDFFWTRRREPPLNLICLGSDPVEHCDTCNNMQAARYESGLDNSPMYDGSFYNETSHHMQLYDVGMSSMLALDMESLLYLAVNGTSTPRTQQAQIIRQRHEELVQLIQKNLWDNQTNCFVNKFSQNNTFYRRVSPTSFYPMLAAAADDEQAKVLSTDWLMNPNKFCITPDGDMKGNADTCWWGLPSINADDPAYPPLGYWRGYVWGPMAQLTFWSLSRYTHVPEVATGRTALCKQMKSMLLRQWTLNHHVCENFNPHKDGTECTGDHFYHWGALTGFISLLHDGYYESAIPVF